MTQKAGTSRAYRGPARRPAPRPSRLRSTPYGEGAGRWFRRLRLVAPCTCSRLDQLHALSGAAFACSDNANSLGAPCGNMVLWPALLTQGVAGLGQPHPGPATRDDVPFGGPAQQVTTQVCRCNPSSSTKVPGKWRGQTCLTRRPAPGAPGTWSIRVGASQQWVRRMLQLQTVSLAAQGPTTVPAASMNNAQPLPRTRASLSTRWHRQRPRRAPARQCAVFWTPVLTSMRPDGPGVDQHALGIIVRPDGTHQVTYNGQPLYLFIRDAYIGGLYRDPEHQRAGLTPSGERSTPSRSPGRLVPSRPLTGRRQRRSPATALPRPADPMQAVATTPSAKTAPQSPKPRLEVTTIEPPLRSRLDRGDLQPRLRGLGRGLCRRGRRDRLHRIRREREAPVRRPACLRRTGPARLHQPPGATGWG